MKQEATTRIGANRFHLHVSMGLMMNLMIGCAEMPGRAMDQVRQADQAYRAGGFADCESAATAVIDAHGQRPEAAEAFYLRGLARLRLNRRDLAERDFESALRLVHRRDLEVLVGVQLGNMAFEDGVYDRARRMYGRAVNDLPAGVRKAEVYYWYALSMQRSGDFDGAERMFRRIASADPSSEYAAMAMRNLGWRYNYFTVQCGAFAQLERAHSAVAELRRRSIDATVIRNPDDRALPYIIHAGRYGDHAAARAALAVVRKVQQDAFVVP